MITRYSARPNTSTKSPKHRESLRAESRRDRGASDGARENASPGGEKLQKVLARAGVGSRREMERWIEQGRVTIDGRPAKLGDRVQENQRVSVDGRALPQDTFAPKARVLM